MATEAHAEVPTPDPHLQATLDALSNFDKLTTSYKTVGNHQIETLVFVPKDFNPAGKVPVIGSFHGGGLVMGSASFLQWQSAWTIQWALKHTAVVVLANYRLLPESSGREILSDVSDFWTWVATSLQDYINKELPQNNVQIDLQRAIAHGGSAGGYLALQSGFLSQSIHPSLKICGLIPTYPMLDFEDPWYSVPGHRASEKFIGFPPIPSFIGEAHVTKVREGPQPPEPVSDRAQFSDLALMGLATGGRLPELLQGSDKEFPEDCYPLRRLEKYTGSTFPPTLIMHGLQDSIILAEDSRRWEAALKKKLPNADIRLELHDGVHGFDGELKGDEKWLVDAIKWFEEKAGL